MAIDEVSKERDKAATLFLIACGSWGLLFLLLPHAREEISELLGNLSEEIGKALVVACVLGAVVDRAIKKDLVKDAVSAAIGYLLPSQLRNEMQWVYGQPVIAEQTFNLILDHRPESHTVIVKATYDRIIRNITGRTAKIRVAGGTDEWFNQLQDSRITTAEYRYYRDGKYEPTVKLETKRTEGGIGYGSEDLIDLRPDELVHLSVAYELACPDNGMECLTYRYPIENPVVQVRVPPTLRANIAMRHREPSHSYRAWETGYLTSRLNGTLLPHQDVYVVWHRADDLAKFPRANA